MNRQGNVFCKGRLAGVLEETDEGRYVFTYDRAYLSSPGARAISLKLPLRDEPYTSERLFPFFHGLLAEGVLKDLQCRELKIDEEDAFGRLLKTAGDETIGDVTVTEVAP
jgi:serine/threonine-protein kinase HipA